MRNLFVFLTGVTLLGAAFALFSRATWGEPIGVESLTPVRVQEEPAVREEVAIPEEVRAKRFVLVDQKETPIGAFGVFNGQLSLVLHDQNKKIRAMLVVDTDGQPALVLIDANGKIRAQFDVENNEPRIRLLDANGKARAQLDVESNEAKLVLRDANGKAAFQAPH